MAYFEEGKTKEEVISLTISAIEQQLNKILDNDNKYSCDGMNINIERPYPNGIRTDTVLTVTFGIKQR